MAGERLATVVAWTRTVKYPQYAKTEAMTEMKSEMIWQAVADLCNIIRSIADAATSQSKNDDHGNGEGIGD